MYHALKHFKYHLFERCRAALKDHREEEQQTQEGDEDEPVKDTVNKVFTKLKDEGWITEVCVCVLVLVGAIAHEVFNAFPQPGPV